MEKLIKNDHYNIHILEENKFKNNYFEVSFVNKFEREKLSVRECLLRMLFMGKLVEILVLELKNYMIVLLTLINLE